MRRKLKNFFYKLYDLCKNNEFCRFVLIALLFACYAIGLPLMFFISFIICYSPEYLTVRACIVFAFLLVLYISHFFWLPQDVTNHFKKIAEYFDEDSEDEE